MPDRLTPADRKRTMQAVKSQHTGPERKLKAMLAGAHLHGWRLNLTNIPGKPDIAFAENKVAIFVDGCFWHGCPYCQRPMPQTNREYWQRKIQRNVERDRHHDQELESLGWRIFRIWEHQLHDQQERKKFLRALIEALESKSKNCYTI